MQVTQIRTLLNTVATEVLGRVKQEGGQEVDQDIVKEDLSGLTQLRTEVFTATAYDNYVRKLVDHIGKMVFVDRVYKGRAPKVVIDGWDYGSVVEKIDVDMPNTEESDKWQLQDGQNYSQDTFHRPNVTVSFFNGATAYKVELSITDDQVKESFDSPEQMNRFLSTIYIKMDNKMTFNIDELIMRTINNMTVETIYNEYKGGDLGSASHIRAVNLLKLYNDTFTKTLTVAKALYDADFLKFASMQIGMFINDMESMSTLFNIDRKARFTPKEYLHVVMLGEFTKATGSYLQADTFNKELVALPQYEEVAYWQTLGSDRAKRGALKVKNSAGHEVDLTGKLLCVLFDRDALGVRQPEFNTPVHRNEINHFWNVSHQAKVDFFNDTSENFACFFIQDAPAA